MTDRDETGTPVVASRRAVLMGAGALGAVGLLAACGTESNAGAPGGATNPGAGASAAPIKATEIPVGGGKIFKDTQLVVTQPTAGNFKAFSAVCTHQGCLVESISNGKIVCPCHMSEFNLDGTVAAGPANHPLNAKTVTASGDDLTVA